MRSTQPLASWIPALGWALVVTLIGAAARIVIGRFGFSPQDPLPIGLIVNYVPFLIATIAAVVLARRGGYHLDLVAWLIVLAGLVAAVVQVVVFLVLGPNPLDRPIGFLPNFFWFLLFWRRERRIRKPEELQATPSLRP